MPLRDDSIIRKEIYPYAPYTHAFSESDEIRIAIQSQDSYLLPSESFLWMQITAATTGLHNEQHDQIYFVKNFASYLFDDVRYELNGVEIDRLRNVGRASTMKLMIASRTSEMVPYHAFCSAMENTSPKSENVGTAADANAAEITRANSIARIKTYDLLVPLSAWFGFCDDYRKIMLNCKHELILNRARQSTDCMKGGNSANGAAQVKLSLKKIQWKMPHITLSDRVKLGMLNYLSKNRKISVLHRSIDVVEYPTLPATNSHMWAVKTVSHVNRPRYVVVGFQTDRKNNKTADATLFDSCEISELRLHMNSQIYPYNMTELNIEGGQYSELYDMYARIQSSYYNGTETTNLFRKNYGDFQECALFAFDTSRADESLIDSSVDIKVEIKCANNMPANTAAYCLIIYDNEFTYSPLDGLVVRKV